MRAQKRGWRMRVGVTFGLVFTILLVGMSTSTRTRASSGWSTPRVIFEGPGNVAGQDLAVDAYGRIHAIWLAQDYSGLATTKSVVYYQRLDTAGAEQLEISTERSSMAGPTVAIASNDEIFVNVSGNLAMHAEAQNAHLLRSWTRVPGDTDSLFNGQVVAGRFGSSDIWIAYADRSGGFIILQRWNSEIAAWDPPITAAQTESQNVAADFVRVAIGRDSAIHLTWGEFRLPSGWPPTGVYYVRSNDEGKTWTRRQDIALGPYDQPNLAIGPSNEIALAWNGMVGVGGRYVRFSRDGGETWAQTTAFVPPGKGGTEGAPAIVFDSRGVLHILTTYDNCAWYLAWANGTMSESECISSASNVPKGRNEVPSMTIGQGNRLHALFSADVTNLYYTMLDIDAPVVTILPTPTPRMAMTMPSLASSASRDLTPTPAPAVDATSPSMLATPSELMLPSVLAALTLVGIVSLLAAIRTQR